MHSCFVSQSVHPPAHTPRLAAAQAVVAMPGAAVVPVGPRARFGVGGVDASAFVVRSRVEFQEPLQQRHPANGERCGGPVGAVSCLGYGVSGGVFKCMPVYWDIDCVVMGISTPRHFDWPPEGGLWQPMSGGGTP